MAPLVTSTAYTTWSTEYTEQQEQSTATWSTEQYEIQSTVTIDGQQQTEPDIDVTVVSEPDYESYYQDEQQETIDYQNEQQVQSVVVTFQS